MFQLRLNGLTWINQSYTLVLKYYKYLTNPMELEWKLGELRYEEGDF